MQRLLRNDIGDERYMQILRRNVDKLPKRIMCPICEAASPYISFSKLYLCKECGYYFTNFTLNIVSQNLDDILFE